MSNNNDIESIISNIISNDINDNIIQLNQIGVNFNLNLSSLKNNYTDPIDLLKFGFSLQNLFDVGYALKDFNNINDLNILNQIIAFTNSSIINLINNNFKKNILLQLPNTNISVIKNIITNDLINKNDSYITELSKNLILSYFTRSDLLDFNINYNLIINSIKNNVSLKNNINQLLTINKFKINDLIQADIKINDINNLLGYNVENLLLSDLTILLLKNDYDKNLFNYYIYSINIIPNLSIESYTDSNFNQKINNLYNIGYKIIISDCNSDLLNNNINTFNDKKDLIFLPYNCSTLLNKQNNIFLLQTDDYNTIDILFYNILPNLKNIKNNMNIQNNILNELSPINNSNLLFNKIICYYTNDVYGNNFKNILDNFKDFNNNYTFIFSEISQNEFDESHLTDNDKSKIILFISNNPQLVLNKFTQQYNKFMIFSHTFANTSLDIPINFNLNNSYIMFNSDNSYIHNINYNLLFYDINKNITINDSSIDLSGSLSNPNMDMTVNFIITTLNYLVKFMSINPACISSIIYNNSYFEKYLNLYNIKIIELPLYTYDNVLKKYIKTNQNKNYITYSKTIEYNSYNPNIIGTNLPQTSNEPTQFFPISLGFTSDIFVSDQQNRLYRWRLNIINILSDRITIRLSANNGTTSSEQTYTFYYYKFFNNNQNIPNFLNHEVSNNYNSVTLYDIDPSRISLFTQPERMTTEIINSDPDNNLYRINMTNASEQNPITHLLKSSNINICNINNVLTCIGGQFNLSSNGNIINNRNINFYFGNYSSYNTMIIPQEQPTINPHELGMGIFFLLLDTLDFIPVVGAATDAARGIVDAATTFTRVAGVIQSKGVEIAMTYGVTGTLSIPFYSSIQAISKSLNRVMYNPSNPNIFEINSPSTIKNYIIQIDPFIEIHNVTINLTGVPNSNIFIENFIIRGGRGTLNANLFNNRTFIRINSINGVMLYIKNLISDANNIGLDLTNSNTFISSSQGSSFNFISNNIVFNYLRPINNRFSILIMENVMLNTWHNWVNNQIGNWTVNYLRFNNPNYAQYEFFGTSPSSTNRYYLSNITAEYVHIIRTTGYSNAIVESNDRFIFEFNCNTIVTNSLILVGVSLRSNSNIHISDPDLPIQLGYNPIINNNNSPFIHSSVPNNVYVNIYNRLILFGYGQRNGILSDPLIGNYGSTINSNLLRSNTIFSSNSNINCFTIRTSNYNIQNDFIGRWIISPNINITILMSYSIINPLTTTERPSCIINCVEFDLLHSISSNLNMGISSFNLNINNLGNNDGQRPQLNIFGRFRNEFNNNIDNGSISNINLNNSTISIQPFNNLNNNDITRFNNFSGNNHLINFFNDSSNNSNGSFGNISLELVNISLTLMNSIFNCLYIRDIETINITSNNNDSYIECSSIGTLGNVTISKINNNNPRCEINVTNGNVDRISNLTLNNSGFYVRNGQITFVPGIISFNNNDNNGTNLIAQNGIPTIDEIRGVSGYIDINGGSLGNPSRSVRLNQETRNRIRLNNYAPIYYTII